MSSERNRQIYELFHEMAKLPKAQRADALRQRCGDDEELYGEVLSLLRRDEGHERPTATEATPPPPPEGGQEGEQREGWREAMESALPVPRLIGKYRIDRVIGAGGMGIVYLAVQDHPHRTVALKVLRAGIVSRSAMRRFEFESEILARLRHPGIAQVYEAGTHRMDGGDDYPPTAEGQLPAAAAQLPAATAQLPGAGVPYFAMEYIPNARSLTEHADAEQLGMRQRLELFVKVCQAVHHGHQKGIIHRDLKPGNILVDPSGEPKIIDFGVARVTDLDIAATTARTDVGQLIGTLQYMSPEQCAADPNDLDVRSDVYALGVILYELLCGRVPYDISHAAVYEAARVIQEQSPARPSTISRTLRGDIETITLKAMEKDRERRYRSAADLADDITRYLNNEPIEARPPSISYHVRMFARRHRTTFSAISAVFIVLVAATVVSLVFAVRANLASERARDEAEQRRAAEEDALAAADEARIQASIAQAVNEFLNDYLLAVADPRQTPDRALTVREALDAAAAKIDGRFEEQPLVEAAIRESLGDAYQALGEYELAEPHLRETLRLRRNELGDEHPDTLIAMSNLAALYDNQGRYEDAEWLYRQTLELKRRVLGEDDQSTLVTAGNLVVVLCELGRVDEAEPLAVRTLEHRRRVLGDEHEETLSSVSNLATIYIQQSRYDEAEPMLVASLDGHQRRFGEEHPQTLTAMHALAFLYRGQERYAQAEPLFMRALGIGRRVEGADHPTTLHTMGSLAEMYHRWGRLEQAEPLYVELRKRAVETLPPESLVRIVHTYNLAELYLDQGRLTEAEPLLAEAIAGAEEALPPEHPYLGIFLAGRGRCLIAMEQYEQAERALLNAHALLEPALGAEDEQTVIAVRALADLYEAWNRPAAAAEWRGKLPRPEQP